MSFNYPKNWILVVKFLKTFIEPRSVAFPKVSRFATCLYNREFYSPGYYASVSREKDKWLQHNNQKRQFNKHVL